MKRVYAAAALALLCLTAAAWAEPQTFELDKPHSLIGFSIRHFFTKVEGRFQDFSGTIVMDQKNPAASSVSVSIVTASISTANDRRDTHLKSNDFFAADSFPALTFKSTRIEPGTGSKFKVYGDLTMRGITKPVVLDAELLGVGPIGMGGQAMGTKAGFEATTTVNRQDFHISWNKTLDQGGMMLGDDVAITLHVEANQVQAKN